VVASPSHVEPALNGQLVSVTERVTSVAPLGDDSFLIGGPFVTLVRRAEMFAWVERCDDRSNCHYAPLWTDAPPASARFREPRGQHNAAMRVLSGRYFAEAAVGVYAIRTSETGAPCNERVQLSREMLRPDAPHSPSVTSRHYLYIGDRSIEQSAVGDLRLSYYALHRAPPRSRRPRSRRPASKLH